MESFESEAIFDQPLAEHLRVIAALQTQLPVIRQVAARLLEIVLGGGKVLWCGNGGSAADSQHLAAELVGRYKRDRKAIPSIALTTDTSLLTSVGNDYGYEDIFSRQVEGLCGSGDALVGISTSGNSPNVCKALVAARQAGAFTVAFTGRDGGAMKPLADCTLFVDSKETARIQEAHILAGHMICDWIDRGWASKEQGLSA
jgi:D-sedoheptulose 7-phosphate isomerase